MDAKPARRAEPVEGTQRFLVRRWVEELAVRDEEDVSVCL
jgi:hypothetical protein